MKENCTGAGIILFFDNRGVIKPTINGLQKDILFLFLKCFDGKFDFPKGTLDHGEFPLDCAIRETQEETSLSKDDYFFLVREGKDFSQRERNDHVLRMCIAEIKNISKIIVKKSPKLQTKEHVQEHEGFVLKRKEDCKAELLHFLKEPLEWSSKIILDYLEA
jgi:8-oxo-dGTP pyrophosphatase MutT (NUDIX family)